MAPGPDRLEHVLVEVERGEDHDLHVGQPLVVGDAPGGRQPVDAGHADVHQHDVGPQLEGEAHGLVAVGGLADDGDVVLRVEQGPEPAAHQRLVVGDDDGDHDGRTGRWASDPEPAAGPRPGLDRAAQRRRPLAHPDDAVAGVDGAAPPTPSSMTSMRHAVVVRAAGR